MTTSDIPEVIAELQSEGRLPKTLTAKTVDAMTDSLTKYFDQASDDKIDEFVDKAEAVCKQMLVTEQKEGVTTGLNVAGGRSALGDFIESLGVENVAETMNVDFFLRIAGEVANGAGQYLVQNYDQTRLDEFPALELHRVYDVDVPRGSLEDKKGPEDGWDYRWQAACEEAGDDDALRVFNETGRMVALKSSDVWASLGDGAGGYKDTLGNRFAPFAWNSGMDTDEVSREDAVALGLIDEGEKAEPAAIDFKDLLSFT